MKITKILKYDILGTMINEKIYNEITLYLAKNKIRSTLENILKANKNRPGYRPSPRPSKFVGVESLNLAELGTDHGPAFDKGQTQKYSDRLYFSKK
jgi:hypothetical protein